MRQHRGDPDLTQPHHRLLNLGRNAVVAEFHQKIAIAGDGIPLRVELQIGQILIGHVEVAAQAEFQAWTETRAQLLEAGFVRFAVIGVALVGVRSGDHVLDAVGLRHAAHCERNFPGLGAVIDLRKNVRMNIEQCDGPRKQTPFYRVRAPRHSAPKAILLS